MINRKLCGALCVTALVTTAALSLAGTSSADPPGMLVTVPRHQHYIKTPNGTVPVGPNVCEHPELQHAFNQFHFNVHHSHIGMGANIPTLGPQLGARGLNNKLGADLVAMGCPS